MLVHYGARIMNQWKVYTWVERFKSGRTGVTDESQSGCPSTSRMEEHVQSVDDMTREDRRIISEQVAAISYGSAQAIVHGILGYCKVCARWVQKKKKASDADMTSYVTENFLPGNSLNDTRSEAPCNGTMLKSYIHNTFISIIEWK